MPEVVMPRLSDSMEEATIVRWLKADGDQVRRGDEIVEIETDKATMTYEAEFDGVLRTVAAEDEVVALGAPIAFIGNGEGSAAPAPASAPPAAVREPVPTTPSSARATRPHASPLARRVAAELGVELAALSGSGVGGRIVKADVEAAANGQVGTREAAPPAVTADAQVAAVESAKGSAAIVELTRLQQTVARRMAESKATVPEFILTVEVDMEEAVVLRDQMKQNLKEGEAVPSYNDFVVKSCALALRDHPRANGAYRDGRFELYERVNVGIAVAGEDSLLVPVIDDVDRKSLGSIAREARSLAASVRDGSISPPRLAGGTFTVSNLGMLGIDSFTAVINSPQAAILAVGAMKQQPVVHDGELIARQRVTLTLTCDHRILYGADAAQFLATVRENLERPLLLAF